MADLDLRRARLWTCPVDVLVCPSPHVEVWVDMLLTLVYDQFCLGSRWSVQSLEVLCNVHTNRIFLRIGCQCRQSFTRARRWTKDVGICRNIGSGRRWRSLERRLGLLKCDENAISCDHM